MTRNRKIYFLLIMLILIVGLSSRKYPNLFPAFLAEYLGDTLWALLVFWLLDLLWPSKSTFSLATYALVFSYVIEISQLYHARWIDSIRNTTIGALVLGHGFLWSDIICYTVGIGAGVLMEYFFVNKKMQ